MKNKKAQIDNNRELQRALLKSIPIEKERTSIWNMILAFIGICFLAGFFITHDYWNLGGAITFLVMSQLVK